MAITEHVHFLEDVEQRSCPLRSQYESSQGRIEQPYGGFIATSEILPYDHLRLEGPSYWVMLWLCDTLGLQVYVVNIDHE